MFVLYFLLASVVTTVVTSAGMDTAIFANLKVLSKFFVVMAMAAIGLNTNPIKLIKTGGPALGLGAACWLAISIVSLTMQALIGTW